MKIALVIKHFSLYQGGAERQAVHLSRALVDEGHEVHVLANRFEPHGPPSVKWHPVPVQNKPSWWKVISFALNACKLIRAEHFDIVYGLTQIYPQDMYRMADGVYRHWMNVRFPFAPLRWINYVLRPVHLANLYLEHRIYRSGNNHTIIAISQLCKQHAQKYYGVPEDRIEVIYNGVDQELFHPQRIGPFRREVREELNIPPDAPVILFVSNNWKRKGLSVLLRSMAMSEQGSGLDALSPAPACHLLVVGRGRPRPFIRLSKKLGIEDRVRFAGPTREIERYYSAADLFVLPTLYDSFANVCLESMACGVPVITSASSGAAEIIREGVNGYVLKDPLDAEELARLLTLCSDMKRLGAMGEAARESASEYTRQRTIRQTLDICRRVIEAKGGARGERLR